MFPPERVKTEKRRTRQGRGNVMFGRKQEMRMERERRKHGYIIPFTDWNEGKQGQGLNTQCDVPFDDVREKNEGEI